PPYPGSTIRVPIDVDGEEDEVRDLRCTVVLRGKRIRGLLREMNILKRDLEVERDAAARMADEKEEEVSALKELNRTIIEESNELRGKLVALREALRTLAEGL
ncbi:hypothetical protein GGG16DRAFT_64411, partial [Schizophyllum commune]